MISICRNIKRNEPTFDGLGKFHQVVDYHEIYTGISKQLLQTINDYELARSCVIDVSLNSNKVCRDELCSSYPIKNLLNYIYTFSSCELELFGSNTASDDIKINKLFIRFIGE